MGIVVLKNRIETWGIIVRYGMSCEGMTDDAVVVSEREYDRVSGLDASLERLKVA